MRKSNGTLVACALGAILLVGFWHFSTVDAYQRGAGRAGGTPGQFERERERPAQLPVERPGERGGRDDRPDRGGSQGPTVQVHNHFYGNNPSAAAQGGVVPAGYSAAQPNAPGYAPGYGYDPGYYNQYGPGTRAINLAQAQHQSIDNHNYAVQSYYANRDLHDQYVAARSQPLSPEQRAKLQHQLAPGRLSPEQFDRENNIIRWPSLLRRSEFDDPRVKLDHLFHSRTPDDSGESSENYVQVSQACGQMSDILDKLLRSDPNMPGVTFCAVDQFIRSLKYEAEFPVNKS